MGGTATTPNIAGLPPGAVVKPLGGNAAPAAAPPVDSSTLPPGAVVKPLGGNAAPGPTAPGAAPTQQQQPNADPGVAAGMWETTVGPIWEKVKADFKHHEEMQNEPFLKELEDNLKTAVMENPEMGGGVKMIWGIAKDAYDQGKKSAQAAGKAAKATIGAGKSVLSGDLTNAAAQGDEAQRQGSEAIGHGLAAVLPVLGPMAAKAGEDIGSGKTGEGIGEGLGAILNVVLGSKLGKKVAAGKTTAGAEALDEAGAARKLTDAINPNPDKMATMRANFESELPRLKKYAEQAGIPLNDRAGILKAARQGADEYQALYDKQLLEPIQDKLASNGKTFSENEMRLRHLNRTTSYNATTAAESEAQVARKAEAAGLRDMMNNDMAKALNVKPEQIAEARSAGEKMRAIADQTELSMDVESHSKNAGARGSTANVHATPHGVYATGGGRIGSKVNKAVDATFGHPGDNAVRDVFQKYNPGAEAKAPAPNVFEAEQAEREGKFSNRPEPRAPGYKQNPQQPTKAPGSSSTIADTIKAKEDAARQRTQERGTQNARSKQSREEAAHAQAAKNRATHGKYKNAADAMGEE